MSLSFVFPGQGSQSIKMMETYGEIAIIKETFDEASNILGEDLWAMVQQGPEEILALTVNTQPIMLTAGVAVYRAWLAQGGQAPTMVAGHSLGEYTALVVAGALDFSDAVQLVRFRAQVMQEAVPAGQGGMAAILGLDIERIQQVCEQAKQGEVVSPANLNAPGQIVIAGNKQAVERAIVLAKEQGAKRAILLPVSAPFHCDLMKPAAQKLAQKLATIEIKPPKIEVINNVDVCIEQTPSGIVDALVRQAYSPVRWIEIVEKIDNMGFNYLLECGPGKVLTGMNKRIVHQVKIGAINDAQLLQQFIGES